MEFIQSPELPAPAGHYSQAVVTRGGLVYVSGVLPARDLPEPSFEAQCASVFDQCERILRAAGCRLDDVVQCTAYLAGVEHWPAFRTYPSREEEAGSDAWQARARREEAAWLAMQRRATLPPLARRAESDSFPTEIGS